MQVKFWEVGRSPVIQLVIVNGLGFAGLTWNTMLLEHVLDRHDRARLHHHSSQSASRTTCLCYGVKMSDSTAAYIPLEDEAADTPS